MALIARRLNASLIPKASLACTRPSQVHPRCRYVPAPCRYRAISVLYFTVALAELWVDLSLALGGLVSVAWVFRSAWPELNGKGSCVACLLSACLHRPARKLRSRAHAARPCMSATAQGMAIGALIVLVLAIVTLTLRRAGRLRAGPPGPQGLPHMVLMGPFGPWGGAIPEALGPRGPISL